MVKGIRVMKSDDGSHFSSMAAQRRIDDSSNDGRMTIDACRSATHVVGWFPGGHHSPKNLKIS